MSYKHKLSEILSNIQTFCFRMSIVFNKNAQPNEIIYYVIYLHGRCAFYGKLDIKTIVKNHINWKQTGENWRCLFLGICWFSTNTICSFSFFYSRGRKWKLICNSLSFAMLHLSSFYIEWNRKQNTSQRNTRCSKKVYWKAVLRFWKQGTKK